MKPIFVAHLDLACNALHWNRDLEQPLDFVRKAEAHMDADINAIFHANWLRFFSEALPTTTEE